MKIILTKLFKIILIFLFVSWIFLVIYEYTRHVNNKPMLVIIKEETKTFDDGHVYIYYGLGYKKIVYERYSIYGKEFGHLFITIKDKIE